MKRCPKCMELKDISEFVKNSSCSDGTENTCKECRNARLADWYKETERSQRSRAYHLKNTYNMTLEEYDILLQEQSGGCAICGKTGQLHVDHSHITGKVRGLLCPTCNRGIGQLQEDSSLLRLAAAYLDRTEG